MGEGSAAGDQERKLVEDNLLLLDYFYYSILKLFWLHSPRVFFKIFP